MTMELRDRKEAAMALTAHIFCDRKYHDWSGLEIFAPREKEPRKVLEALEADEHPICKFMQISYTLKSKLTWTSPSNSQDPVRGHNGRSHPISRQRFLSEKCRSASMACR